MEKLSKFNKISNNLFRKEYDIQEDYLNMILDTFKFFGVGDRRLELSSCSLNFILKDKVLEIEKPLAIIDDADLTIIQLLDIKLQNSYLNIIECLIDCDLNISLEKFFDYLKNDFQKKFEFLNPYKNQLEKLGINFQLNENQEMTDVAINCKKYIKFIDEKRYDFEFQIEQHVAEMKNEVKSDAVKVWMDNVYKRYLLNNNPINLNKIHHVIDWFNSLTHYDILSKSLSFDKAVSQSDDWVRLSNQKLKLEFYEEKEGLDIHTIYSLGSYSLVHLLSDNSRIREGQKMVNCIGSIYLKAQNVYSIRYNGKRIASYRLNEDKNTLQEIKGPCNDVVNSSHHEPVRKILENQKIDLLESNDIKNIGLCCISIYNENEHDVLYRYIELISNCFARIDSSGKCKMSVNNIVGDLFSKLKKMDAFNQKKNHIFSLESLKNVPFIENRVSQMVSDFLTTHEECLLTGYLVKKDNPYLSFFKEMPKEYFALIVPEQDFFNKKDEKLLTQDGYSSEILRFIRSIFDNDKLKDKHENTMVIYYYIAKGEFFPSLKNHPILYRKIIHAYSLEVMYRQLLSKLGLDVSIVDLDSKLEYWVIANTDSPRQIMNPWQDKRHRYDCNCCNNHLIVKDLVEKEIGIDDVYDNFDKNETYLQERIHELDNQLTEIQNKLKEMAQSILWMPCFDYINGKIVPDRDMIRKDIISIYDKFYANMNWKMIYDATDFIKNGYFDLKSERDSCGDKIREYIQHILELNIDDCVGCRHCTDGYIVDVLDPEKHSDCDFCNGDFRPCDHAEKIREFSEKYEKDTFLKYYNKDEKEIQDDMGYLSEFIDSLAKFEDLDEKMIDELVNYILSLNHQ